MSPRFAWIGGEVTTQAPEPLEFRIKTTSNSTPRAALRIDGQTLPLEKADRLEQVDLASPGPVSWVTPVFLPRRQTVEVLRAWAAETRRPEDARVKAVQRSWSAAGHLSFKIERTT